MRLVFTSLLLAAFAPAVAGVASVGLSQKAASDPKLLPLPVVKHFKKPGEGYSKGSPLYKKEQVLQDYDFAAEPRHHKHEALPASNTIKCVSVLVTMFFVAYGALFLVQTLNRFGFKLDAEERSLSHAAHSLFFAPMLCTLFLAARMRAVQLAKGHSPMEFDLPAWWMKWAEILAVVSNVVITMASYAGSSVMGEDWDDILRRRSGGRSTGRFLLTIRRLATLVLYVCFGLVCAGACTMSPPPEIWEPGTGPEVSPALSCTIFLASVYFGVYLCLAAAKNINESGLLGEPVRFSQLQKAFHCGASTLSFAPMLCCLFISVRMRALQMDPVSGNPQEWVQACFYAASASVALQSALSILASAIGANKDGADVSKAPVFHTIQDTKTAVVEGVRLLLMGGLFTWVGAILIGLFLMKPDPESPTAQAVPIMPTSLICVAVLSCLFFGVYLLLWVGSLPSDEQDGEKSVAGAQDALGFCPMIAVVYMCVMIRSLQLSHGYGAPQDWVQIAEVVGTCAIVILWASRALSDTDSVRHQYCTAMRYASLLALYICIAMVMGGFYGMTPSNVAGSSGETSHGHSQTGDDAMGIGDGSVLF